MRIGTESVLSEARTFPLRPVAWWRAYGFCRVVVSDRIVDRYTVHDGEVVIHARVETSLLDPRLWIAFFVGDLGYVTAHASPLHGKNV